MVTVYLDGADPDGAFYQENFADVAAVKEFQEAQRRALALAVATWRERAPHKWLGGYAARKYASNPAVAFDG